MSHQSPVCPPLSPKTRDDLDNNFLSIQQDVQFPPHITHLSSFTPVRSSRSQPISYNISIIAVVFVKGNIISYHDKVFFNFLFNPGCKMTPLLPKSLIIGIFHFIKYCNTWHTVHLSMILLIVDKDEDHKLSRP